MFSPSILESHEAYMERFRERTQGEDIDIRPSWIGNAMAPTESAPFERVDPDPSPEPVEHEVPEEDTEPDELLDLGRGMREP